MYAFAKIVRSLRNIQSNLAKNIEFVYFIGDLEHVEAPY